MITLVRLWLTATRAPFFTASIIPALLGAAAALHDGYAVQPVLVALTVVGVVAAHAGANLANDFYDHLTGADWLNRYRTPFNGGSGVIQRGLVAPRTTLWVAAGALSVAGGTGVLLAFIRGWPVLVLMGAGGLSAILYTAGSVRLAYRGWGEALVGLNFGAFLVCGSYFLHAGRFGVTPLVVSLPVSLLIIAVLFINQFPDIESDAAVGKRNWVVRVGTARALLGYYLLVVGSYAVMIAGVLSQRLPAMISIALVTMPLAAKAMSNARRHHGCPGRIVPSCALTVGVHALTGFLLTLGLIIDVWLYGSVPPV